MINRIDACRYTCPWQGLKSFVEKHREFFNDNSSSFFILAQINFKNQSHRQIDIEFSVPEDGERIRIRGTIPEYLPQRLLLDLKHEAGEITFDNFPGKVKIEKDGFSFDIPEAEDLGAAHKATHAFCNALHHLASGDEITEVFINETLLKKCSHLYN